MAKKCDRIRVCMKLFAYFDDWDEDSKHDFCALAKTKNFKADDTILGDGIGMGHHAYFVVKGRCCLIEELCLGTYRKNGKKLLRLEQVVGTAAEQKKKSKTAIVEDHHFTNSKSQTSCKSGTTELISGDVNTHFMQVCIFDRLSCFNLGESLQNRGIIAIDEVETISVPLYVLLQNNKNNVWNKVKNYLICNIPNTRAVYEKFVRERTWYAHKKKFLEEMRQSPLLGKFYESHNTVNNVPYSIRINQEFDK